MKSPAQERFKLSTKIASTFVAGALAFAMVPAMAFAADATSGTLVKNADVVYVQAGSTTDLDEVIEVGNLYGGQDAHIDYKLTAGAGNATVNKHSGVVTGIAAGTTATVTAYLTPGETPSKNSSNPCFDGTLDTETIQVEVVEAGADVAGYQGIGFQMDLDSPADTLHGTVNDATGAVSKYINKVGGTQAAGSTVTFRLYQNAGLNQYLSYYDSPEWGYASASAAYKDLAGQYITYTDASGATQSLKASASMTVSAITASYVDIDVPVGAQGTGTLHVDKALHTFKQSNVGSVNKSLGVDIDYVVTVG